MLEDIAAIVLDNLQITLTAQLLSACAAHQIALITVDETHLPNGILQAFLPHSRALKVMRAQLAIGKVLQKKLWQQLVQQKITNQASVLAKFNNPQSANYLGLKVAQVKPGDTNHIEAQAAQYYFSHLFGKGFYRKQENLINTCLNYGYSLVRSAIARSLVAYGCLPAFGLQHCNEQNAFNLADDLIEPFRPHVDAWVLQLIDHPDTDLNHFTTQHKAKLVELLHQDLPRLEQQKITGKATLLALVDMTVISLVQAYQGDNDCLVLPAAVEPQIP